VIFISTEKNYAHHLKLSKKLGCGIEKYLKTGQLAYIDCFSEAGLD
jgi:hypothetical protein